VSDLYSNIVDPGDEDFVVGLRSHFEGLEFLTDRDLEITNRSLEEELLKKAGATASQLRMMALQQELRVLRTRYMDRHPVVQQALRKLEELEVYEAINQPIGKVRQLWAAREVLQINAELSALRALGYGPKHPRILESERRRNALKEWRNDPGEDPSKKVPLQPAPEIPVEPRAATPEEDDPGAPDPAAGGRAPHEDR
jgi:hypothetical protein